ncbi:MAG: hypothetical protein KDB37_16820 [Ilumatobacter sp.]|nr:hypothetical protein [Ilumatobacter sp.]
MQTSRTRPSTWTRRLATVGVLALALAACGGGDDDTDADDTDVVDAEADEPAAEPADDATTTEPTDAGDETTGATDESVSTTTPADDASGGTYEPGPIGYRVVSLLDEPVDVYVRTTGLVEAFEAQMGVEPGAVTEFFYPPEGGPLVITTAGSGDATCVATCDHILANVSSFDGSGDVHTLVLYEADGRVTTFDAYEEPAELLGNSNEMVAADPATGQFVAIAVDVTDADFGMRLGFDGVEGCLVSVNLDPSILVGGNQTPAFAYDGGSADVLVYANDDRECAGEPIGGPFTVEGGAGTRSMLVLTGSPGSMDAIVVGFLGSADASDAGDSGDTAAGGDAETAYALMADELTLQIGLPEDEADCLAPFVVDAIGLDVALVDGELIDLDEADAATQDLAFGGIVEGIEVCGIDPAILG